MCIIYKVEYDRMRASTYLALLIDVNTLTSLVYVT